ncbi:uncharacterized protein IWZ02DRAFT_136297 [Phyllosticta citriasiana]|uniref:uncharacterized protein n=1 Tax=Phyllosticta citriasiana TaxID=595635 RepID=UPI0030FD2C78
MNCDERQRLLDLLTSAVAATHPHASHALANYIARPLTDHELAQLVQGTIHSTHQPKRRTRTATCIKLLRCIDRAKTQYATYLRATDKRDIRVYWIASKDVHQFGPGYRREHWLYFSEIYARRYEEGLIGEYDGINGHNFTGFSVVVDSSEHKKLTDITAEWPLHLKDNISQTYAPLVHSEPPRTMKDICVDMVKSLVSIHASRFDFEPTRFVRGNEHWHPFPCSTYTTHERLFNHYRGTTLEELNLWDRGDLPEVVIHRGRERAGERQAGIDRAAKCPNHEPPVQVDEENIQRAEFFSGKLGGFPSQHGPGLSGLPLDQPAVTGRYNKAGRMPPPPEYRIMASSDSGEDSGSVAVASLSLVTGNVKRMKSFVQRPSRGEPLTPSDDEEEPLRSQGDQTRRQPLSTPPSSPLSLLSVQLASSNTGLETPPSSTSPVKPTRLDIPNRQFKRRVPSAASKLKRKKGTPRRPGLKSNSSQDSVLSNASTTATRTTSSSSLDPLARTSTDESKITPPCVDSPSPTNLWTLPSVASRQPALRKDSGLGTFSPGRQATTSIQRVDALDQRTASAHAHRNGDSPKLPPSQMARGTVGHRKDSCFSAPKAHLASAAMDALMNSASPKAS